MVLQILLHAAVTADPGPALSGANQGGGWESVVTGMSWERRSTKGRGPRAACIGAACMGAAGAAVTGD